MENLNSHKQKGRKTEYSRINGGANCDAKNDNNDVRWIRTPDTNDHSPGHLKGNAIDFVMTPKFKPDHRNSRNTEPMIDSYGVRKRSLNYSISTVSNKFGIKILEDFSAVDITLHFSRSHPIT